MSKLMVKAKKNEFTIKHGDTQITLDEEEAKKIKNAILSWGKGKLNLWEVHSYYDNEDIKKLEYCTIFNRMAQLHFGETETTIGKKIKTEEEAQKIADRLNDSFIDCDGLIPNW